MRWRSRFGNGFSPSIKTTAVPPGLSAKTIPFGGQGISPPPTPTQTVGKSAGGAGVSGGNATNTICPGFIKTKMNEDFLGNPPDAQHKLDEIAASIVPMGIRGEGDDIAYALVYMASDESKYMTGSHIVVDGGWTAY